MLINYLNRHGPAGLGREGQQTPANPGRRDDGKPHPHRRPRKEDEVCRNITEAMMAGYGRRVERENGPERGMIVMVVLPVEEGYADVRR